MNLWFRLLWLALRLRRAPRAHVLDEAELALRVLPTDLDVLGHVNNGRYLTLMDLGRIALSKRCGVADVARQNGWFPLVRGVEIEYIRPLRPFQRFSIHSRLISWDAKWLYVEQRFVAGETLHAHARVRALFRGRAGNVPSAELLAALGQPDLEPPEQTPSDVAPHA